MSDAFPTWVSMTSAAACLGVQPARVREMVDEGQFPAAYVKKSGDRYIFHPYALNPPLPTPDAISPEVVRQVASATATLNALLRTLTGSDAHIG
jgi:hypothetical protein